jgi:hypothetical protein
MNTGKRCTNDTRPIVIGCAPESGDIYDMNTGKKCLNNTKVESTNKTSTKAKNLGTTGGTTLSKTTTNTGISSSTISTEESPNQVEESNNDKNLSGREKLGNSTLASAAKMGSILTGPMSIWIILLILVILLGGGYGVYSFNLFNKDNKEKVPEEATKNTTPATPATPKVNTPVSTHAPQAAPAPANTQASMPLGSSTPAVENPNIHK